MKFLNHLDLSKTELRNAAIQVLGAAPSSPAIGQIYYDSTVNAVLFFNGSGWSNKATDSALLNGNNSSHLLNRTNHTGSQNASTISDLASVVKAYRLDEFAAPTSAVAMNGQRLTGLATPTADQDAATRGYVLSQVENAAAGIDSKPSVRLVSTSNITRAGLQTIDGIALLAGERILLVGQSAASENGVYVVAAGAWTRAVDADSASEITPGAFWFIEEGNTYGRSQWRCNNTGTITIGSTAITIVQFGAATMYTAGNGLQVNNSTEFAVKPVSSGGITVSASGVQVDTTIVARKYSTTIGDGTTTSIAVTHNLGTKDIQVSIRETTTDTSVWTEWVATNTNTVTLNFTNAPAASGLRVSVVG